VLLSTPRFARRTAPARALLALAAALGCAQIACNLPLNVNIQIDPNATAAAPAPPTTAPPAAAPAEALSLGPATLLPPEGWAARQSADELVIAQNEADLDANPPQGPRLTLRHAQAEVLDPLAAGSLPPEGEETTLAEDPALVSLGGLEGVAVAFQIGDEIERSIVINVDGLQVYEVMLEAPAGQWDSVKPTWDAVLATVEFAPA
jgi:hypothetical protein